jgi:hypothetical protein
LLTYFARPDDTRQRSDVHLPETLILPFYPLSLCPLKAQGRVFGLALCCSEEAKLTFTAAGGGFFY